MKLFLSVGTVYPMDRLVKIVDDFVGKNTASFSCVAQVGSSHLKTNWIKTYPFFLEEEFKAHFLQADIIISHAGIGNLVIAKQWNKPIIVMCRRAEFGEHVDNHQVDTAKGLGDREFIYKIDDESDLEKAILWARSWKPSSQTYERTDKLVSSLKRYIQGLG